MLTLLFVPLWLILILTDIWLVIDSARLRVAFNPKQPYTALNGPVGWVICCVVLWVVVFPRYLYQRARVLKERGHYAGASAAVTWVGAVLVLLAVVCTAAPFLVPTPSLTERLRDTVNASIQRTYQSNPAQKNIRVKSLSLAHETGDLYKGILVADVSGSEEQHVVEVNYDGKGIKWQIH